LYKLSLRTAHEVTNLVYSLDLVYGDKKAQVAEETLAEAAKALGVGTNAVWNTLRQIEEDPFARFLVAIWHWPEKPAKELSPSVAPPE